MDDLLTSWLTLFCTRFVRSMSAVCLCRCMVRASSQCHLSITPWRRKAYLSSGMPVGCIPSHWAVMLTDASLLSWGAVWNHRALKRAPPTHKCVRVGGRTPAPHGLSSLPGREACACSVQQLDDASPQKPQRGEQIEPVPAGDPEAPVVGLILGVSGLCISLGCRTWNPPKVSVSVDGVGESISLPQRIPWWVGSLKVPSVISYVRQTRLYVFLCMCVCLCVCVFKMSNYRPIGYVRDGASKQTGFTGYI